MPKVSAKRQITIPIAQCIEAQIKLGDEIETFIFNNQITIIKKVKGSAKGILNHIKTNKKCSNNESLQDAITNRRKSAT
jgi:bifunctional DNA-binding transcriptional regulator/antitoxin component of YhaV-PrlF toxin-antitoxin module